MMVVRKYKLPIVSTRKVMYTMNNIINPVIS